MARKKTPVLTDGERAVMEVLWDRGRATAREVMEDLSGGKPMAFHDAAVGGRNRPNRALSRRS